MKKILVAVSLATTLIIAGCSSSDSQGDTTSTASEPVASSTIAPAATNSFELRVGENSGKDTIAEFKKGDKIELVFINNSADDDIHVHGYDISTGELKRGMKSSLFLTVDKVGDFEVESHVSEEVIMILRVTE